MKCPCCGHEMDLDNHRKIDLFMCYECGYIEGRRIEPQVKNRVTNYERLKTMNINETAAFLAKGLQLDEQKLAAWLDSFEN